MIVGQGQPRLDPARDARGTAGLHRGGGRVLKHHKRKGRPSASSDATEGNLTRLNDLPWSDPTPAQAPGPPGRGRPPCRHRAGRRPRRPGAADRRRPRHRPGPRAGDGRRKPVPVARQEQVGEAATAQARAAETGAGVARGPAGPRPRPGDPVRAVRAARERAARDPVAGRRPPATPPAPGVRVSSQRRDPEQLEAEAAAVREGAAHRDRGRRWQSALEGVVTARRVLRTRPPGRTARVAALQRRLRTGAGCPAHRQVNAMKRPAPPRRRGGPDASPLGPRGRPSPARPGQRDFYRARDQVAGLDRRRGRAWTPSTVGRRGRRHRGERLAGLATRALQADRDHRARGPGGRPRDGGSAAGTAPALLAASDEVSGLLGSVARPAVGARRLRDRRRPGAGSAADAVAVTDAEATGPRDRSPQGRRPWRPGRPAGRGTTPPMRPDPYGGPTCGLRGVRRRRRRVPDELRPSRPGCSAGSP